MKTYRYLLTFTLIISALILSGCEDEDDEKVFGAQKCFNNIDDSLAGSVAGRNAVAECQNKMAGVFTNESQLLRCGIELWIGGINNAKIFGAFDTMESVPENQKEATLMNALVLVDVVPDTGSQLAANAYTYCDQSKAPGMVYVTALIKLGTDMEAAAAGDGTAANIVNECIADTVGCSNATNGQILIDTAGLYCLGESESNEVCQAMNAAIDANPGNPAGVMATFLTQIDF